MAGNKPRTCRNLLAEFEAVDDDNTGQPVSPPVNGRSVFEEDRRRFERDYNLRLGSGDELPQALPGDWEWEVLEGHEWRPLPTANANEAVNGDRRQDTKRNEHDKSPAHNSSGRH